MDQANKSFIVRINRTCREQVRMSIQHDQQAFVLTRLNTWLSSIYIAVGWVRACKSFSSVIAVKVIDQSWKQVSGKEYAWVIHVERTAHSTVWNKEIITVFYRVYLVYQYTLVFYTIDTLVYLEKKNMMVNRAESAVVDR